MPQVLVTQRIDELQRRSYAVGTVVNFSESDLITWLKGRRMVDDTPAVVAAAISGGAVQRTHLAGVPNIRRPVETELSPEGATVLPAEAGGAVARVAPFGLGAVASAGDSIADFGYQASATIVRRTARGALNWALALAGQPFDYLLADDYAMEATDSAHLLNVQVPLIEATSRAGRKYARIYVSCGTNDFALFNSGGLTPSAKADETVSNLRAAFARLRAIGAQVDWPGIRPRGTGARLVPADGSFTATKQHAAIVNAMMSLAHLAGEFNMVDCLELLADNSTPYGNMLAATNFDGLHLASVGAFLEGKALAVSWARSGIGSAMRFISVAGDLFSRTGNCYGAINPNPLLAGDTSGAPTGYTVAGGSWAKVSRTLANGQTRSDPTCTLAVGTVHRLLVDVTATGAWTGNSQIAPGDVVEGRAILKLSGVSGLRRVTLIVRETNGGAVADEVDYLDLSGESADTGALPVAGDESLWLRVPRVPIRAYDGSGNAALRIEVAIETASGVGAGTVAVQGLELRPVTLAS